ncbi:hypothetical protein CHS0354_003247 [Potamilus streckersoni]|uniref:Uncharacterized protein n=1 Tax=Potamilus streckersoni TaxID=2493646 RepID=A0AAE0VMC0_9BIVA|nr:hypothetical protein CHS0354_003247 [Potamilus streckersoni]
MKSQLWLKIQSQWNRIIYDLRASNVLDSLMGKMVISFDDYERISKQETENDKARKLLQILKYKDDQHYDNFLAALDENEYGNIADAIREAKIPQASIELDTKEEMWRIPNGQERSATKPMPPYQKEIDHIRADLKSFYQSMIKMPISIFDSEEQVPLDEFYIDILIQLQTEGVCCQSKTKVQLTSYKQIFPEGKNKRIILTGLAGSGKSTFCKKLISIWCRDEVCSKWDSTDKTDKLLQKPFDTIADEEALLKFSLVYFIYAPDISTEKSLIDVVCNQCKKSEADNRSELDTLQKIFEEQPEKILLIIDGMDETDGNVPSFLSDLFGRKLYPRITVLLAMRQFRISELGLKAIHDLLLETGGLSKKNALMFVAKIVNLNKNHMTMEKLCPSPEEEEELSSFRNVPLLLLFLTHIWCQDQCLPMRRQDLYRQILDCLIKKCLIKTGNAYVPKITEQGNMTVRKDMFCKMYLNSACMAAYHFLLVEKKGRIPEEKLMSELGDNSKFKLKALLDCGILSQKNAFSPLQRYVSIKFLHFSVQEYLASMYLVNNEDAFQTFLTSLKSLNNICKYKNLFIFICGLDERKGHMAFVRICEVCDEDPLVIQFRQGRDDDGETKYSLQGLNLMYKECLKEMNSQEIIEIPDIVSLEDEWYVTEMSRLRSSTTKSLYLCCVTLHRDDALDLSSMINLRFLSLCGISMSEECSRSFCSSISCCVNMKTLKLEGMTLHDHMLDLSSLTNLNSLTLVDVTMSEKCLCSGISDCTNLERLKFKLVTLDDYLHDVRSMTNLTCLTLDHVTMSENCSKSLCSSIGDCKNLTTLQLEGIQLHDGILNLSRLTKLASLTLKNAIISDECNRAMFCNISSCTHLERLQLEFISVHNGVLDLNRVKDLRHLKVCDVDNADNPYKNI